MGLGQPLADGLKALVKEDFTPAHVRKAFYWMAPALVLVPSFVVLAVVPFGSMLGAQKMVIADLDVGILFTFGIVSLGVYGIVLAGYASNSKYPFLGGIRATAQMISYEIAMGMAVVPVFMLVGDLNLVGGDRLSGQRRVARVQAAGGVCHFSDRDFRRDEPAAVRSCRSRRRNWLLVTIPSTVQCGLRCFSWANTPR